MRRVSIFAAGVLSLAAAVSAIGGAAAAGRGNPLTVIFEDRQQQNVDTGVPGPTPGDYYVFAQRLEDPDGATVGNLYGRCTSHFDGMEICEGDFAIDGTGLITVQTAFTADFSEPVILAVTGGTDRYDKVRGEGRFTSFPDGRLGVVFRLFP